MYKEEICLPIASGMEPKACVAFLHLLEVYVDDFIQLAQTTSRDALMHCSRALMHVIHSVFPPPEVTGHAGKDPILLKKLREGKGL